MCIRDSETAAAMLKNGRNLFAVGNRTHGKAVAFAEKYNIGRVYAVSYTHLMQQIILK